VSHGPTRAPSEGGTTTSAGQAAGADPGLHAGELSEEESAEEERVRSETSVSDLVGQDLDTATPSRRAAGGEPQPGSFDVPLRQRRKEPTDGG
jgi:hypothetical protein